MRKQCQALRVCVLGLALLGTASGPVESFAANAPLVIRDQGARPFGGTQVGDPAKASISCDHGYVEWQIPRNARKYPLLMVHASSTKRHGIPRSTAVKASATSFCVAAMPYT